MIEALIGETNSSAAGDAHMAGERRAPMAPVDDEIVPPGLARDCFIDGGIEQVIGLGRPQRAAQVRGVFLAEAHEQRARAGDADAVAGFAEIVGDTASRAD